MGWAGLWVLWEGLRGGRGYEVMGCYGAELKGRGAGPPNRVGGAMGCYGRGDGVEGRGYRVLWGGVIGWAGLWGGRGYGVLWGRVTGSRGGVMRWEGLWGGSGGVMGCAGL